MEPAKLAVFIMILNAVGGVSIAQTAVTFENAKAKCVMTLAGGKTTSFSLKSQNLNPLHTSINHFICFDRWGSSSPQDRQRGIPFHGEASSTAWVLDKPTAEGAKAITAEMSCVLPVVKLKIVRRVDFDKTEAVYRVTETITNENPDRRIFNLVQHVTIGAPFLDQTTIVDTKVEKGFWQSGTIPPSGGGILGWPEATVGGKTFDLRYQRSGTGPDPWVVSYMHAATDTYGWVTAVNAAKKLLIGYIWPLAEYPWLNLWSSFGHQARGLEFGTTGLHQPFPVIEQTGPILGRAICEYIPPDRAITKSYMAFLAEVPGDYQGVDQVEYQPDRITIKESGGSAGKIVVPIGIPAARTRSR